MKLFRRASLSGSLLEDDLRELEHQLVGHFLNWPGETWATYELYWELPIVFGVVFSPV